MVKVSIYIHRTKEASQMLLIGFYGKFRKSIFGSPFLEVRFRKYIFGSTFRKYIFRSTLFSEIHFGENCPHLRELDLRIGELRTVRNYSDLSAEWCTSHFRLQGRVKKKNLRRPERSLSTISWTRTLTPASAPAPSPGPKGDKRSSGIASSSAAPYSPTDAMES